MTQLQDVDTFDVIGRVRGVVGFSVRVSLPGAAVGETCQIRRTPTDASPLRGEVVGFDDDEVLVMPYATVSGLGPEAEVRREPKPLAIRCGEGLLGRVLDGLGDPIDGGPPLDGDLWPVHRPPPAALDRPPIDRVLPLGVRALDALTTVGEGQRVGLFASSGVGKSVLLGQIARQTDADVVVIGLVGERGREVRELLDRTLGDSVRPRTVLVCATSDQPAMLRLRSAHVATAVAEWFRDRGQRVLLLLDSVTRFARAGREVGLAAGEPPARRGYPPSVFASLPRLFERAGKTSTGSLTAIYTVLVEGNDFDEPIADEVRGLVDGHIVLSRRIAETGRFPAVDVVQSLSRLMERVASSDHRKHARRLRSLAATYDEHRDS